MTLGEIIRDTRKRFGYSLKDLSQKTHLSVGYLSNLERDVNSPTLEMLDIVCNALRINLVDLIRAQRSPAPLLRKADRKKIYTDRDGTLENAVVDNDTYRCTCYSMNPGYQEEIRFSAGDTEAAIGYLLSGGLEVRMGGSAYRMEPGDTIYIQAHTPYSFRQLGPEGSVTLWFYLRREG